MFTHQLRLLTTTPTPAAPTGTGRTGEWTGTGWAGTGGAGTDWTGTGWGQEDPEDLAVFVPQPVADRVAGQLATVARASCRLAAEADRVLAGDARVDEHTVARLEVLLVELRAAVQVRAELAATDPDLLLAGARRLRRGGPAGWSPAPAPASGGAGGHVRTGAHR